MLELSNDKMLLPISVPGQAEPVGLYYRMPMVPELQKYKSALIKVKNGKVKYQFDDVEIKLRFGATICTGIREGDFGMHGHPISSELGSEFYDPDWKEFVCKKYPQLIMTLAAVVFEGVRAAGDEAPMVFTMDDTVDETTDNGTGTEAEAEDTVVPLSGSSAG